MSSRSASHAGDPGRRPRGALTVLLLAALMGILDVLIVNVAAPSIQRDLHASFDDIQAVISGYVLVYAVTLTTGARLGDTYGRRRVFVLGVLGFTAFSAACAAAPSAGVLIVLRLGQGLAAALMLPQVLALIQMIFPPKQRARPLALYAATLGLGAVLGQIIGGALLHWDVLDLGWRSVFLVNVPVGLTAAACVPATLPRHRPSGRQRLDLPGLLLSGAAMTLLIVPLIRGGADGWPLWVWPAFAASALALVALWQAERREERAGGAPLVRPSLFRSPGFRIGLAITLIFYSGNYGLFLLLAYVFQDGLRLSPLASGVAFVPLGAGFAGASLAGRRLLARYGNRVLVVGAGTMAAGYLVLVVTLWPGPASSGPVTALVMAPALLVAGVGQGIVSAPLIGVVLATVPEAEAGAGSGMVLTANQLASSLGVAVLGSVFVGLLGADPQDAGARAAGGEGFASALVGCSWVLLALAGGVGVLAWRLPGGGGGRGGRRVPSGADGS
ncbi:MULTISPECIES: MFS transporter [unclassified Streptomyces]|uniref:MFS transporter n=1 Tax=unclassified Streptomyces TaxID=2593676 RepID=UPI000F705299|nr:MULTISPECIES: MFS transporter [unclassified Streptomyces]AZM60997.1 MFS transporter [Streptomyces sp. WAC 01438]RSM97737.1 MFS transporter [Streptomyces sp. WAC 01420]